jgi:hypothetical protein
VQAAAPRRENEHLILPPPTIVLLVSLLMTQRQQPVWRGVDQKNDLLGISLDQILRGPLTSGCMPLCSLHLMSCIGQIIHTKKKRGETAKGRE